MSSEIVYKFDSTSINEINRFEINDRIFLLNRNFNLQLVKEKKIISQFGIEYFNKYVSNFQIETMLGNVYANIPTLNFDKTTKTLILTDKKNGLVKLNDDGLFITNFINIVPSKGKCIIIKETLFFFSIEYDTQNSIFINHFNAFNLMKYSNVIQFTLTNQSEMGYLYVNSVFNIDNRLVIIAESSQPEVINKLIFFNTISKKIETVRHNFHLTRDNYLFSWDDNFYLLKLENEEIILQVFKNFEEKVREKIIKDKYPLDIKQKGNHIYFINEDVGIERMNLEEI